MLTLIYAITDAAPAATGTSADRTSSLESLRATARGIDGAPLSIVIEAGFAAIISHHADDRFATGVRIEDLRTFEHVAAAVAAISPMLPVRFAPIPANDGSALAATDPAAGVRRFIACRADHLRTQLAEVGGMVSVSIHLDVGPPPSADKPPAAPVAGAAGGSYLRARAEAYAARDGVPAALHTLVAGPLAEVKAHARKTRLEGPRSAMPLSSVHLLIPASRFETVRELFEVARPKLPDGAVILGPTLPHAFVA
ncbi:MAG: GvpL/GvpF family gas vesicle protein [Phycisphaerales bacterium]|jgi:hypothetical protein|nr:GvpL/GvpF family gas vesicle protein [Phycisphaeraceae bacterium]